MSGNNMQQLKLIRKARFKYIYLDYLNKKLSESFASDYSDKNKYAPYVYAGMLFNVSMDWLDNDCEEL